MQGWKKWAGFRSVIDKISGAFAPIIVGAVIAFLMEAEGGTGGVEPRPYAGPGIVRGDITDCHTSDVGHWLAMTEIMEVRCMSAGRRGLHPLRKGQQEVQCAANGGVRAPHPTHGSRVRCAGNTDRRVAALLATAVFWRRGGYRSLLIRPAAPALRRWHPGWERSRLPPSCCRLRRGRGRER